MSKESMRGRTAYHEAGHATAALWVPEGGVSPLFEIKYVEIGDGGTGICSIYKTDNMYEPEAMP
jgi:hypothetical protein